MPIQIELTKGEVDTLKRYLQKAVIDAEGSHAIGVATKQSVDNLKSVMKKIGGTPYGE